MTVPSTVSEIPYAGDGVTVAFPIPFPFDTSADIVVKSTDSSGNVSDVTASFTITGGGGSTGTATAAVAPAADVTITIIDDPEQSQETDYIDNDAFPAPAHERALDKLTRIAKRLSNRFTRTLRTPDGDPITDLELGSVSARKGKFLFFNAVTGAIEYALSLGTTVISQSVIGGLLNPQTSAESAALVTPLNLQYEPLNVLRYGADPTGVGDSTTAIQSAIDVAEVAGGAVIFPNGRYRITSQLTVSSTFPVHLIGEMGFARIDDTDGAFLFPGGNIAGSMVRYVTPTANRAEGGGGHIIGISFADSTYSAGSSLPGTRTMTAALELTDFNFGKVQNCTFHAINGSAIKAGFWVMGEMSGCVVRYCGDTSKPAILLGDASGAVNVVQSTVISGCKIEVCHDAPYIKMAQYSHNNKIIGCGFEAETTIAASCQTYIDVDAEETHILGCHFNRNTGKAINVSSIGRAIICNCEFLTTAAGGSTDTVTLAGNRSAMTNCRFIDLRIAASLTVSGLRNTVTNCIFYASGGVVLSGNDNTLDSCVFDILECEAAYWIAMTGSRNKVIGCSLFDTAGQATSGGIQMGGTLPTVIGNSVHDLDGGAAYRFESSNAICIGNAESNCTTSWSGSNFQGLIESNIFVTSGDPLTGSLVWDPGSLADGAGETSSGITVTGAELGDFVDVGAPYTLQGIQATAYVAGSDTVAIRIQNETGGVLDLASGTWYVKVRKRK